MKKTIFSLPLIGAAMALCLTGCKSNDSNNAAQADKTEANSTTTEKTEIQATDEPALYDNYDNAKYGFSVIVPKQLTCTDETPLAEGANYALKDDEETNMMSVIASDNYGGKPFTADDIKGEMDNRVAELGEEPGTKVTKTETADGWTITVEGGELYHQVYVAKYKAGRRYELTYIYSKDNALVLGNSVEEDVLKSLKVK